MKNLYAIIVACAIFLLALILPKSAPHNKVMVYQHNFNERVAFTEFVDRLVIDAQLHEKGWDTLAQPVFWQKVMLMPPDSSLINIAATRQILTAISSDYYFLKSRRKRDDYKDSLRTAHDLDKDEEIYITTGKNHFYKFDLVLPKILKATGYFSEEKVDPWYAQAILLIESPNQLQASLAGAYGPFQLMRAVAREHGLTVNRKVDERADLEKSARGAASLLRKVCIPKTKEILDDFNISYQEKDIWFRLMVLHVYHAGGRNVASVMRKLNPKKGGMPLIQELWQTEYRGFRNASQNYSQVALATMLTLNQMVEAEKIPTYLLENKDELDTVKPEAATSYPINY